MMLAHKVGDSGACEGMDEPGLKRRTTSGEQRATSGGPAFGTVDAAGGLQPPHRPWFFGLSAVSYAVAAQLPINAVTRAAHTIANHPNLPTTESVMLHYAVVFLVIALIAAVFGFGGIAASAVGIAQVLFVVFLVMAVVSFLMGVLRKG